MVSLNYFRDILLIIHNAYYSVCFKLTTGAPLISLSNYLVAVHRINFYHPKTVNLCDWSKISLFLERNVWPVDIIQAEKEKKMYEFRISFFEPNALLNLFLSSYNLLILLLHNSFIEFACLKEQSFIVYAVTE